MSPEIVVSKGSHPLNDLSSGWSVIAARLINGTMWFQACYGVKIVNLQMTYILPLTGPNFLR